jgi:CheY-like chemotaxis protein
MINHSEGFPVACAEDGEQALELVRQEIPLLVISDVAMPRLNGDRLFARVRDMGIEYSCIPFIFITGDNDESRHLRRISKDADGHINKPFEIGRLLAHVKGCVFNLTRREALLEISQVTIAN